MRWKKKLAVLLAGALVLGGLFSAPLPGTDRQPEEAVALIETPRPGKDRAGSGRTGTVSTYSPIGSAKKESGSRSTQASLPSGEEAGPADTGREETGGRTEETDEKPLLKEAENALTRAADQAYGGSHVYIEDKEAGVLFALTDEAAEDLKEASEAQTVRVEASGALSASSSGEIQVLSPAVRTEDGEISYLDPQGGKKTASSADEVVEGESAAVTLTGWQTIDDHQYYFDPSTHTPVTGQQLIDGKLYQFSTGGALLDKGHGIDISKYQNIASSPYGGIDWSQVRDNVSFVIIRCAHRSQLTGEVGIDPYFYANMQSAKAAGIPVGTYIYSQAVNAAEALEEADTACDMVDKAGGVDLPVFMDWEGSAKLKNGQPARNYNVDAATATTLINTFTDEVSRRGYRPGLYANRNWLYHHVDVSGLTPGLFIWLAEYNKTPKYTGHYDMWQYTSGGSVPGIAGRIDMDILYTDI